MSSRSYGQFCGLAHAINLIGERWGVLIIRNLLVGPKRFTDLKRGLPRIPTNVLSTRLREFELNGVVERRILPRPDGSVVYALTAYGQQLEPAILSLSRWGAQTLGVPGPDDIVTVDSMIMAMRTTFRPDAARNQRVTFELRLEEIVFHLEVDDGHLTATPGPADDPDLVIETGPDLKLLMAGEITPAEALADGIVRITGEPPLLDMFAAAFRI